jgi:hypothetical protein
MCSACIVKSICRISNKGPCIDTLTRFYIFEKNQNKDNQITDQNAVDHNKNFDVCIEPWISRAQSKSPIARTVAVHGSPHNYIFAQDNIAPAL